MKRAAVFSENRGSSSRACETEAHKMTPHITAAIIPRCLTIETPKPVPTPQYTTK
jgi:hypothetical protein